jgi:8-oxo-dGTP pyrophosphatase MutT (NUDIX family)
VKLNQSKNRAINCVADFAPEGTESGVGLALQDNSGRFLFFIAGTRHKVACPPGELFYAGIGGHREKGEGWLMCAHREANEEIGTDIDIVSSSVTWNVARNGFAEQVELIDKPRPFALYDMVHPAGTPRAGELYHIVIYKAHLKGMPRDLPPDEVQGVIALTVEQVIQSLNNKSELAELLADGASLTAGGEHLDHRLRLYPLGTARALAHILSCVNSV